MWYYAPELPELAKRGLLLSIAANEVVAPGTGPIELTATAAARFHALAGRAVADAKAKGQTLERDAFKARTIEALVTFDGAAACAMRVERPFPDGSSFAAVIHRVAFAERGRCYRLTLQGRSDDVAAASPAVHEALKAMTFAERPQAPPPTRSTDTNGGRP